MIDFLKDNFVNILVVVILLVLLILINIYIYKPENKKLIKKVDLKYKYY